MKEKNKTHSPFYKYAKIYRQELTELKKVRLQSQHKSYAFTFLLLLSNAVCENVDSQNIVNINGNKPNMYLTEQELKNLLNVKSRAELNHILNNLVANYNAIQFKIIKSYCQGHRIYYYYFYFNICNQYIEKGNYSRNNVDAFNNVMAIKNNEGFILVNKTQLFDTFYKTNKNSIGIEDLYLLLRLNTVFNSNNLIDSVPEKLKNFHIALWKNKNNNADIEYSLYCRQSDFSSIFGVSTKTISRYMKILKKAGLIDYSYLYKRGTVISFSYLDQICDEYENREKIRVSSSFRTINFVTEKIIEFIIKFSKNIYNIYNCKYSLCRENLFLLNVKHYEAFLNP